jgi:hypothetical protein
MASIRPEAALAKLSTEPGRAANRRDQRSVRRPGARPALRTKSLATGRDAGTRCRCCGRRSCCLGAQDHAPACALSAQPSAGPLRAHPAGAHAFCAPHALGTSAGRPGDRGGQPRRRSHPLDWHSPRARTDRGGPLARGGRRYAELLLSWQGSAWRPQNAPRERVRATGIVSAGRHSPRGRRYPRDGWRAARRGSAVEGGFARAAEKTMPSRPRMVATAKAT